MALLRDALITPRGVALVRPLRLMVSPFKKEMVALQTAQPWVGNPAALSPAQIRRTVALTSAATAARGTFGTVFNPATGRMMPAIAAKVRETITGKIGPEERITRRRAAAARYAEARRRRPEYLAYKALVAAVGA